MIYKINNIFIYKSIKEKYNNTFLLLEKKLYEVVPTKKIAIIVILALASAYFYLYTPRKPPLSLIHKIDAYLTDIAIFSTITSICFLYDHFVKNKIIQNLQQEKESNNNRLKKIIDNILKQRENRAEIVNLLAELSVKST